MKWDIVTVKLVFGIRLWIASSVWRPSRRAKRLRKRILGNGDLSRWPVRA